MRLAPWGVGRGRWAVGRTSGASPPSPPLAGRGKCRRGREMLESVVRCVVTHVGEQLSNAECGESVCSCFALGQTWP